jgi:hypothetical protein
MKYLLLLLAAPALAAEPSRLSYTNDINVRTVLTQTKPSWCFGMKMAFDVDGLDRAYYGCWMLMDGFAHIEMLDGSRRVIPLDKFTQPKEATK